MLVSVVIFLKKLALDKVVELKKVHSTDLFLMLEKGLLGACTLSAV